MPWDVAGTRNGDLYTHTFKSLGTGHVFTLAVRGVDSRGTNGTAATVKCSTRPRDMLTLKCTTNALLVAEYTNPYTGTGLSPVRYTVKFAKVGATQATSRITRNNIEVDPAEFGEQYQVTVTASHQSNWAQYTETDTVTCPTHTDNWNSPNFFDPDEDCPNNILISRGMCIADQSEVQNASAWRLRVPKFEPISGERVLLSRSCTTPTSTGRTCNETWTENITLLKDPKSVWEALGVTEWSTGTDIRRNLATIFAALSGFASSGWGWIAFAGSGGVAAWEHHAYYSKHSDGAETLKLFPTAAAAIAAGSPLTTTNTAGCLSPYQITPRSDTVTDTSTFGTFTDTRKSTYHYCDAN